MNIASTSFPYQKSFTGFVRFNDGTLERKRDWQENSRNELPPLPGTKKHDLVLNTERITSYEPLSNGKGMHLVYSKGENSVPCHIYGKDSINFNDFHNAIIRASQTGMASV